jgi:hypothetical protein
VLVELRLATVYPISPFPKAFGRGLRYTADGPRHRFIPEAGRTRQKCSWFTLEGRPCRGHAVVDYDHQFFCWNHTPLAVRLSDEGGGTTASEAAARPPP